MSQRLEKTVGLTEKLTTECKGRKKEKKLEKR